MGQQLSASLASEAVCADTRAGALSRHNVDTAISARKLSLALTYYRLRRARRYVVLRATNDEELDRYHDSCRHNDENDEHEEDETPHRQSTASAALFLATAGALFGVVQVHLRE